MGLSRRPRPALEEQEEEEEEEEEEEGSGAQWGPVVVGRAMGGRQRRGAKQVPALLLLLLALWLALGALGGAQAAPTASTRPEAAGEEEEGGLQTPWSPSAEPPEASGLSPTEAASASPAAPPGGKEEEEEEGEEEETVVHSGTDFLCNCSSLGSVSMSDCNSTTGQCACRPGFAGQTCDRCEEGYYLDRTGAQCVACECHPEGSVSLTCNSSGGCRCKVGAAGQKCERCEEGYSKFNGTSCDLCRCNNHTAKCDSWSGICQDCQGNTEGPFCEWCKAQFYRNNSQRHACLLCPCSNVTSTASCRINPGHHLPTCDVCLPGYTGALCDKCDDGYYNSDSLCVKCQCNGNVDPVQFPKICKSETGECLGCLFPTAGLHCEQCQEGYVKSPDGGNCTKMAPSLDPAHRGLVPTSPDVTAPTSSAVTATNATLTQTTVHTVPPIGSSDNTTSTLADVSWTQFNIIILTVIIILVVLLMGFVGAVYTYREYQNRKLNAPFWTIELKEDNISFSSYHDSLPNADVSGLLEDDGNEVAPNGQLALATPMHNYKA